MLEEALCVQRSRGRAATGGEFAEIFVEDQRSSSAGLDDGKVEELTSGHDRGAGIRVVVGDTTGFAHTADLTEDGLRAAAEAAAAAARGGGGGARVVADSPRRSPGPNEVADLPRRRREGDQGRAAHAGRPGRPRAAAASIKQVSAGYARQPPAHPRRQQRRRARRRRSGPHPVLRQRASPPATPACRPGYESIGHTIGFELFDRYDVEDLARRPPAGGHEARARPAPSGTHAGRHRAGRRRRAVPRGMRSRARGRPRRQGGVACSPAACGELVASPLVTLVDDGTMADEWGSFAIDDEGQPAQRNVLIQDGVLTDYMWDSLRARKEGRASS